MNGIYSLRQAICFAKNQVSLHERVWASLEVFHFHIEKIQTGIPQFIKG